MALANNSEVIKAILEDLKISVSEGVPSQIANQIVPVLVSNPKIKGIVVSADRAVTGAGAVYSVPNDGNDYYLIHAYMTINGSAAYDGTEVYLRCDTAEDRKTNVKFLSLKHNAGGAAAITDHANIDFQKAPIRLTPSSTIDIVPTFTAGAFSSTAVVIVYKVSKY